MPPPSDVMFPTWNIRDDVVFVTAHPGFDNELVSRQFATIPKVQFSKCIDPLSLASAASMVKWLQLSNRINRSGFADDISPGAALMWPTYRLVTLTKLNTPWVPGDVTCSAGEK